MWLYVCVCTRVATACKLCKASTCVTFTLIGLELKNADNVNQKKDEKPLPSDQYHISINLNYSRGTLSSKEQERVKESNCCLDHEASSLLLLFNQDVFQLLILSPIQGSDKQLPSYHLS